MSIPGSANPLLFASVAAEAAGYQIERSIRLNSSDSAHLSRTPSSAGNRKTWTWSGWVKRSKVGAFQTVFGLRPASTPWNQLIFRDSDVLQWDTNSAFGNFTTTQVFRDVSAWYHIVLAIDTTAASGSDRVKLYINGTQVTDFSASTTPSQNQEGAINTTVQHNIGAQGPPTYGDYFNGYLADVHFIDGQALAATDFGEYDDNNVWQPKAYSGTYGTNGFHLDFSDNTSTTTIAEDSSGNNNDWTANNLSVASGAGNDSLIDTPTNYEAASGNGGNYATFNPLNATGSGLSNGNLDLDGSSNFVQSTIMVDSGKYYFEFTKNGNGDNQLGIAYGGSSASTTGFRRVWRDNNGSPVWLTDGSNAGSGAALSCAIGDVIGVALDMDNNAVYFSKNGTYMNSGDPTSGSSKTGAIWTDLSGQSWGPVASGNANGVDCSLNTGQRPFAYTAPSGFKSLCTQNLTDPTIADGSTAMDAVLYTGNGTSQSITGLGFSPDLVWIKSRTTNGLQHYLLDTVRGATKRLISNQTFAESTVAQSLTAFNSDGFSVGSEQSVNQNSDAFVSWAWDGGTSTAANTDGSITSSVRANPSAGFSIVSYTGASGNNTIGHGLNAEPELIIVKSRSAAYNWRVYSKTTGADKYLTLNATSAAVTDSGFWPGGATSSVFGVRGNSDNGYNGQTFVAYCFAPVEGYSAFGSYTGNGSTDGPFVYTGHRSRWLMVKRTDSTGNWVILDTARNPYNPSDTSLYADDSYQDYTPAQGWADILSNGFKPHATYGEINASGGTYVYASFAESPFKYSRAR